MKAKKGVRLRLTLAVPACAALFLLFTCGIPVQAGQIQVVDTGGWLDYLGGASLAEIGGKGAILYQDSWPVNECRYALSDGTSWTHVTISGARRGRSLIQIGGQPAFVDGPWTWNAGEAENIGFWVHSPTGWSSTVVDSSNGKVAGNLAVIGGQVHLTYSSIGGGDIYHSVLNGGVWQPTLVFDGRDWVSGGRPSLAEIGGSSAIAFYGGLVSGTALYYAEYDGIQWQTTSLGPGSAYAFRGMQLTSYDGDPVIVDALDGSVRLHIRHSGTWQTSTIDAGSGMGLSVIDRDNCLGVSHIVNVGGIWQVRFGLFDGIQWAWQTIDTVKQLDYNETSLAVINGEMGLAYEDHDYYGALQYTQVPEPAGLSLLALGGLAAMRRRRKWRVRTSSIFATGGPSRPPVFIPAV